MSVVTVHEAMFNKRHREEELGELIYFVREQWFSKDPENWSRTARSLYVFSGCVTFFTIVFFTTAKMTLMVVTQDVYCNLPRTYTTVVRWIHVHVEHAGPARRSGSPVSLWVNSSCVTRRNSQICTWFQLCARAMNTTAKKSICAGIRAFFLSGLRCLAQPIDSYQIEQIKSLPGQFRDVEVPAEFGLGKNIEWAIKMAFSACIRRNRARLQLRVARCVWVRRGEKWWWGQPGLACHEQYRLDLGSWCALRRIWRAGRCGVHSMVWFCFRPM